VVLVKFAPFPEWISSKATLNQMDLVEKTIKKLQKLQKLQNMRSLSLSREQKAETRMMRDKTTHELLGQF
jgi:hypothetical protein